MRYPTSNNNFSTAVQFFNSNGTVITIASETDISSTLNHNYAINDYNIAKKGFDILTGENESGSLIDYLKATSVHNMVDGLTGGGISNYEGIVVNPRPWMIYERTDMREFSFEFNFYPTNSSDAEAVKSICDSFNYLSLPKPKGGGNHRLKIPDFWTKIKFINNKTASAASPIGPCSLISVTVNHGPNSKALHSDGNEVNTSLSLQFKEMQAHDTGSYDKIRG